MAIKPINPHNKQEQIVQIEMSAAAKPRTL